MKRFVCTTLTFFIIFIANNLLCASTLSANFSILPSVNTPIRDEDFDVSLNILPPADLNISTFRFKVDFDNTKLKYTGLYSNYGSDDFKAYLNGGSLTVIYLTSDYGIDLFADELVSFLDISFKVLDSADLGATSISASIDGIGNYDVQEIFSNDISDIEISIVDEESPNCNLKSIYAQGYTITPDFSPSITQYYTTVPYDVSSLEVVAEAEDSSASVSVSRKKLSAAGKTTDIMITVTGSDNKSKKIYKLTVLRSVSSDTSSTSSSSKNGKSGSKSSSSSSGYGSSSKSSNGTNGTNNGKNSSELLSSDLNGLSVIKSNFNFALFFIVSSACVGIAIFIIKRKSK